MDEIPRRKSFGGTSQLRTTGGTLVALSRITPRIKHFVNAKREYLSTMWDEWSVLERIWFCEVSEWMRVFICWDHCYFTILH